jgi:AraC-like DNA-binding protein
MINRSCKMTGLPPDVLRCEFSNGDGYAMDWHTHDCHMLLLPRRGSLLLSKEDSVASTRISSLSFSAVVPDFGHATSAAGSKESHITLYADPDYVRRYGPERAGIDLQAAITGQVQWPRSDVLEGILGLYERIAAAADMEAEPAGSMHRRHHLTHLNHLLFDECMRIIEKSQRAGAAGKQSSNAVLIRQVQNFINDNLSEHHDIDALCDEFHLSRRHLTRLFRDVTQETVVDYVNRQRVEHAHRFICERGMSALEAGLAVGIESPSYLARLFRKYLGLLPSDCRKHH